VHWRRIFRNILSNWTSYLVSVIVAFMLTPIVVQSLGPAGYGLWSLVLAITGYFGLLDLGIRSSVSRFLSRHLALNDQVSVNRTASTAFAILALGGAVALVLTVIISTFFFDSLRVPPEYAASGRTALLITGFNVALILPLGIYSAMIYASERFDIASGVSIAMEAVRAALVLWVLRQGYGLIALALIALLQTSLQYSVMAAIVRRQHPALRLSRHHLNREAYRELFGFSVYRFIWVVSGQLISYSGAVIIGIFVGAAAITPYALATSLVAYGRNVVFLMLDPFYPTAARIDATGNILALQRLLVMATRIALLAALPVCLGLVFLGEQFITLWVGNGYADAAVVLTILTIAQFFSMPQYVSALVLAGMAKHRIFAYIALAEGSANLALSIVLVQKMGVLGVAWGAVIPALVTNIVVIPLFTLRVLDLSVREYTLKAFLRPALCAVPVAVLAFGFSRLHVVSWLTFGAEVAAMLLVCAMMGYFICLSGAERAAAAVRLGSFGRRSAASA
jgi:O-antigen/teichoic acid export membrane protein